MSYQFRNDIPVYLQIVDIITKQITSGELLPGEKILSVREYAMLLKVNPNTIQRALGVLESNKLIITNRTNGKYVTNDENVLLKYKNDLIIDTYNANPTSMKTSLDFFISIPSSMPKMAILGEMKELGEISESEHKRMITYLSDNPNMEIYLVGQIFNNMIVPDSKYKFFETVVELKDFLESNSLKGYYIFIKGSHSVQLDKVVEFL